MLRGRLGVLLAVALAWAVGCTALPTPQDGAGAALGGGPGRHSPEFWFLTDAEMSAAMGGFNRTQDISLFTSGNAIDVLQDGAAFMEAVFTDISATKAGDFLHMAPYHMDNRLVLKPVPNDTQANQDSNIETVVSRAIARNVSTKVLVNDWNYFWAPRSMLFGFKDIPMVSDKRYPFMGSHHQKTMIVGHDGEAFAFVGGLDFAPDRWDTPNHDVSNPAKSVEIGAEQISWHDLAVRIRGPAVNDVERNFWERWNAPDDPSLTTPSPGEPYDWSPVPAASAPGTLNIQLLRTFPCIYGNYNYAPKGEVSILRAMLKAISQAEKYVYIETPYVTSMDIAYALADALPRLEGVVIATVPCRMAQKMEEQLKKQEDNSESDLSFFIERQFIGGLDYYAKQFMKIVTGVKGHEHKLHAFVTKYIYMHAKVMIVDDVYAIVGSQNVNRRSMTHDSELSVAVVDSQVDGDGKHLFARDLRRRLWAEHLGTNPTDEVVKEFASGVEEWERQAKAGDKRPRYFQTHDVEVDPLQDFLASDDIWGVWDPEGRCEMPGVMTKQQVQSLMSTSFDQLFAKEEHSRAAAHHSAAHH